MLQNAASIFLNPVVESDVFDLTEAVEKIDKPENRELVSAALRLLARRDMSRNEFVTKLIQISRANARTNALTDSAANDQDGDAENANANAAFRKNFKSKFKKNFKKSSNSTSSGPANSGHKWRAKDRENAEDDFSTNTLIGVTSSNVRAENTFDIADPFAILPIAVSPIANAPKMNALATPPAITPANPNPQPPPQSLSSLSPSPSLFFTSPFVPTGATTKAPTNSTAKATTLSKRGPARPAEFSIEEIEAVTNWCASEGFLNEARFTEVKARSLSHRYGAKRVGATLKQKGVAEALIADTVLALKETDLARARAMWLRKFGEPASSQNERNKHVRYLQSRGFGFDVIKRVINGATDVD